MSLKLRDECMPALFTLYTRLTMQQYFIVPIDGSRRLSLMNKYSKWISA